MSQLSAAEEWARQCMEAALPGWSVTQHDDGSKPSMHDLDLTVDGRLIGAAEISAAGDPNLIELWNVMNGSGGVWLVPGLVGGWLVVVEPHVRARSLFQRLPELLRAMESEGRKHLSADEDGDDRESLASKLRVHAAHQSGTSRPGSVYLTIDLPPEKSGGWVPENAEPVADWWSEFLCSRSQTDNRAKLAASNTRERHMFTLVPGFSLAPFAVEYALMSSDVTAPNSAPSLPPEITHCWVMSTMSSGHGWRWSPDVGWSGFSKLQP